MDNLQKIRRYELKYTVSENLVDEIRDYISNLCVLDPHVPAGERTYMVNNLYFDTEDLRFYYDTRFRKLTRFKARARFYGPTAVDFIWPELKYKQGSVVWKIRKRVTLEEWYNSFTPRVFATFQQEIQSSLSSFEDAIYWLEARPLVHVQYIREPYVSQLDNYVRITFDRQLCYRHPIRSSDLNYTEKDLLYYDDPVTTRAPGSLIIMEIKVESIIPRWVIQLISTFDLMQRPFSKYCYAIDNILERNEYQPRCSVIAQ